MFLKNRNISSKIKRSKVTDYATLSIYKHHQLIIYLSSSYYMMYSYRTLQEIKRMAEIVLLPMSCLVL